MAAAEANCPDYLSASLTDGQGASFRRSEHFLIRRDTLVDVTEASCGPGQG